jgi:hypothetical protein
MRKGLDVVGANGLVRLIDRDVMKNGLVDCAFEIGGKVLCRDRCAAQEEGSETAWSPLSGIEGATIEALVVDAMKPRSRLDLM